MRTRKIQTQDAILKKYPPRQFHHEVVGRVSQHSVPKAVRKAEELKADFLVRDDKGDLIPLKVTTWTH